MKIGGKQMDENKKTKSGASRIAWLTAYCVGNVG